MAVWKPAKPMPGQLADAFAALYDWFEDERYAEAENRGWAVKVVRDPACASLIAEVRASGWGTPPGLRNHVTDAAAEERAFAVYRALYSIDQGLRHNHPATADAAGSSKVAKPLLDHYYARGRYNTDATEQGYVLPRWATGFRGQSLMAHFGTFVRARVDRRRVRLITRGTGNYVETRLSNPTFAVVPFLYTLDDATFEAADRDGEAYFRVVHPDTSLDKLKERVAAAVRAIRARGVNIAVFPELVLNPLLVDTLREQLRITDSKDSALDFVIAGSSRSAPLDYRFPIYNAAYVLDSSGAAVRSFTPDGEVLRWIQHKRHRYTLSANEQSDDVYSYKLGALFGGPPLRDRDEAISIGDELFVFEDRKGRVAVMICEDWGRDKDTCEYLLRMNCRLVFVIVMDGTLHQSRWAARRSVYFQDETGAYVVIANSLLLPRRVPLQDCEVLLEEPRPRPQPVGLLFQPQEPDGMRPDPRFACAPLDPSDADDSVLSTSVTIDLVPPSSLGFVNSQCII